MAWLWFSLGAGFVVWTLFWTWIGYEARRHEEISENVNRTIEETRRHFEP